MMAAEASRGNRSATGRSEDRSESRGDQSIREQQRPVEVTEVERFERRNCHNLRWDARGSVTVKRGHMRKARTNHLNVKQKPSYLVRKDNKER
ncbi:hypothetical protein QYF36_015951 [Acer negundo]|nr:hypothetical protein QYF36_015951 [Acer negundo]